MQKPKFYDYNEPDLLPIWTHGSSALQQDRDHCRKNQSRYNYDIDVLFKWAYDFYYSAREIYSYSNFWTDEQYTKDTYRGHNCDHKHHHRYMQEL